jgi:S1-C subfamily serine protease
MKRFLLYAVIVIWTVTALKAQTPATVSDILENVLTSVVTVSIEKKEDTKKILGFRGDASDIAYQKILDLSNSQGSGSGFVIDHNGKKYVITNAHVVEDASETSGSIFVYTINRTKYEAKVVGGDSFYDIAVLEFVSGPGAEVKAIQFTTKEARIGEQVFAIGNPLGDYPYSVSEGIISAKNRVRGGLTGKFGFLQSTATVIWGNSGGPLVNNKGQVVGINSQIAFATMGGQSIWQPQINFALEGLLSNRLINDIIDNNGMVKRAFIGIEFNQSYSFDAFSTSTKDGWEMTDSLPVLSGLIPGSPAEALLKNYIGSKLIKVGNTEMRNLEETLGEFELLKPGAVVKLTLSTNEGMKVVEVTAAELTPQRNQALAYYALEKNSNLKLSMLDDKVYVKFPDLTSYEDQPIHKELGGIKKPKLRGSEITTGTWEVTAAGYDENSVKNMWRVKSLSDLGAAIRLTATLGSLDLYLVSKENVYEDMQVKRISFSGSSEYNWVKCLWY